MATIGEYEFLRRFNFGRRTFREPVTVAALVREIDRYDAADTVKLSSRIREDAPVSASVSALLQVYSRVLAAPSEPDMARDSREMAVFFSGLEHKMVEALYGSAVKGLEEEAATLRVRCSEAEQHQNSTNSLLEHLRAEHDQLQTDQGRLTAERDRLQNEYDRLMAEFEKLKREHARCIGTRLRRLFAAS